MAKTRERLAKLTKVFLTVVITTPVVMSVPIVFMLIVAPAWYRYLSLENDGVQAQAEIINVQPSPSIYASSAVSVDYRYAPLGENDGSYVGQASINSTLPTVGSIVQITYFRDNPSVSQIGDGPGIGMLLVETVLFGFLALFGCVPAVALALRIAVRIWGVPINTPVKVPPPSISRTYKV
jgi:hypothetical protein